MNNDAIGVFDSGTGGLTAVKELNRLLPNENIIYFGDIARVPYGTRSKETVLKYAEQDIRFLKKKKVKMIIAACGTVSTVVPKDFETEIKFTGVVIPAVQAACSATKNGRIGVIGTTASIKSGAYGRAIRNLRPDAFVVGNPCPLLVPLVENGFIERDNKVTKMVVEKYLKPITDAGADTIIMGCTHYPIIKDIIGDTVGKGIKLISAGEEAAKLVCAELTASEMLTEREEKGTNQYYVSDSTELFTEIAGIFLGHTIKDEVSEVNIDELTSL